MKASKKNNQATEVKVEVAPQPLTERQSLRALCKELRAKYNGSARATEYSITTSLAFLHGASPSAE